MFVENTVLPNSFRKWVLYDAENRVLLMSAFAVIILQFYIFSILYPFPNFLPDSYSYIDAAMNNLRINMWPIGYSKFLRLISVFSKSDRFMFFTQFVLLQFGIIFFVLTTGYLYNLGRWVVRILMVALVLNPLWLYVSDFVSSDAIFASFSLLWLTTLLWLMYKPTRRLILVHGLILFYVFSIRYNALYYPIVSVLIIILIKENLKEKILSLAICLIPVLAFIGATTYQYNIKTKTNQFSPFGGWQLAANALYMYAHVSPLVKDSIPQKFQDLHGLTVKHMDSLNHIRPSKRPDQELGIYYLWDDKAPLKNYLIQTAKKSKDSSLPYLNQWAKVSPLYAEYGTWLIKMYPAEYTKYYLWPNLVNYYAPSSEFLGIYNMGSDSVDVIAKEWFGYKSRKIIEHSKDKIIYVTRIFPIILALINVLFCTGFLGFLFLNGFKSVSFIYRKSLLILLVVWLMNMGFSIMASPIVLRYQVFPFIFTFSFAIMLISYIIRKGFIEPREEIPVIQKRVTSYL